MYCHKLADINSNKVSAFYGSLNSSFSPLWMLYIYFFRYFFVSAFLRNCFLCWDHWNGTSLHLTRPCNVALGRVLIWAVFFCKTAEKEKKQEHLGKLYSYKNLPQSFCFSSPFRLLSDKKHWKTYFNQHLKCAAPKCCSKYTTHEDL